MRGRVTIKSLSDLALIPDLPTPPSTKTSSHSPARFVWRVRSSFSTISRTSSSLGLHRPRSSTSTSDAMAGLISPSPVSFLQGGGTGGGGGSVQQQQYSLNVGVNQVLPQAYQQHQQRAAGTLGLGGGLGGGIGGAGGGVGVNLPYSDTPSLPAHLSHQQYMSVLQGAGLGLPVGVGMGGVGVGGLGSVGLSSGSVGSIAGMGSGHEEGKLFSLVIDLTDPNTRETALLELSKKREQYDDLAMVLWHAFGAHFFRFLGLDFGGEINCGLGNRNYARSASRNRLRLPPAFASKFDCSCVQPRLQRPCAIAVCRFSF